VKDYYSILGIARTASTIEIKRTYRRLAVLYHPDKNSDPEAAELFKKINEAYDVLGDSEKRKVYDIRLENPFAELLQQEEQPPHRDPRYRRKKPNHQAQRKPTAQDLIREYVRYFAWITYVGLGLTMLLMIDFMLPYRQRDEQIKEMYTVTKSSARHSYSPVYAYDLILTDKGKQIRIYNQKEALNFQENDELNVYRTLIFGRAMKAVNLENNYEAALGYIYKPAAVFVPLALLIVTSLGVLFRHRVEFLFNVSIVSIVLIPIVLYLIFSL
jgi:curved DNA-binding protein CbpA